ncbi:MAG TPA: LPS assembly protein LptD, partial [Phycisphaerae bacterium]|nr:LPS assembly protein LptD [Phycisphaerae bacterium]
DITPRNERGDITGVLAGKYVARHTTLNLEGQPIAYWPYSAGSFEADRQAFRRATFGYDSDFGGRFETEWHLFNLLGVQPPEGFDANLRLDYFTRRGPAVGIDVDYEREDYYGLFRGYFLHDDGTDDLGPTRGGPPDHEQRGRALVRHRHLLPKGWELTLEASYLSDDQFLESFERQEFENAKDQETLLRLLKRQDNWQYSAIANWRVNEFDTQTERLPDNRFTLIGEPVGDYMTLYSDNRAGVVRYRRDEREIFNTQDRFDNLGKTGSVLRGDTRQEAQFPLPELGPLKLTPFISARGTAWDDQPRSQGHGGTTRGIADYGVHANMIASRVYEDVNSELFDLHKIKHVIKSDMTAFNGHSNKDPMELTPFDSGVEDVADFGGVVTGLRQRWQTKRGGPGRWRTVDWITFDLEAGFFRNAESDENTHGDYILARPEDSISSNFIAANFQYRLSDTTMLVYDGVYDANRDNVGTSAVSLAIEREPRLSYFVGWRYIHDTDSNLAAGGFNYKLSEKHTLAFRETYDIDEGRNHSTEIVYIRKWPRFYTAVAFDVDRTLEDTGINFSIWPEGAAQFGLGSKRYTGLTDSVGLNLR